MVTAEAIQRVLGLNLRQNTGDPNPKSPGQSRRHYAPTTSVELLPTGSAADIIIESQTPAEYATKLYARLAELDRQTLKKITVETPPDTAPWQAVRDRLRRMASESG
ncbi:MAG: hypothetical protein C4320_03800 [Armatimonadota bacterium]